MSWTAWKQSQTNPAKPPTGKRKPATAMKVSLILLTYNRPGALRKVLEGLSAQTRMPDEVIVADDGSGPDTREAIDEMKSRTTMPLHHVWHEDKGFRIARIRNRAIRRSEGEYIVMLDGDCIPAEHFIEDHLSLAKDGCFFQGKRVLVEKKETPGFTHRDTLSAGKMMKLMLSGGISNGHHLVRIPWFPPFVSSSMSGIRGCNMGFFRHDIFAVNGFNQDFEGWGREDSELAVRFYAYGLKRRTHPFMAICFHLWHEEQPRNRLGCNDELLRKAVESNEHVCSNGLVRK